MPNVSSPNGLMQLGYVGASAPTFAMVSEKISSANAVRIGRGDLVKRLATGYIAQTTAGAGAAATVGVFVSCKYFSIGEQKMVWRTYWQGSDAQGDIEALIIPTRGAGGATFVAQSSGAAITFANIGENIDIAPGTVNLATGQSGMMVDPATLGVTATLPLTVVGLYSDMSAPGVNGTDNTSVNNRVVVAFNNSALAGT